MKKEVLQEFALRLAPVIDDFINPDEGRRRLGFVLCVFEFDPGSQLAYIANAQPEDLKAALRECIEKLDDTMRVVSRPDDGPTS